MLNPALHLKTFPTMAFKEVVRIFVVFSFVTLVAGHGRMIDPASRNSAWRYGFPNPKHYTDNELNCGGYGVQWGTNKGRCGVCGDPYHLNNQLHVFPGKYANGIITKTYKKGQRITILIEITSNHRGFFTFRIGDIGKPPMTQEKLTHLLKQPNGATSWQIPMKSGNEVFSIDLMLPRDLSCDHCVIQWWWKTGNSWGCDETGCAVGKGKKQETFVNCADVKILSNDTTGPTQPPTATLPTELPTKLPVITTSPPAPGSCKGTGPWTGNASMDDWCHKNCAAGYCPPSVCKCAS